MSRRNWQYLSSFDQYEDLPIDHMPKNINKYDRCDAVYPHRVGNIIEHPQCARQVGHGGRHAYGDMKRVLAVWS